MATQFVVDRTATIQQNVDKLRPQLFQFPYRNLPPTNAQVAFARQVLCAHLPTLGKIGSMPILETKKGEWNRVDALVDCFNGRARLGARKAYNRLSCLEWWDADMVSGHILLEGAVRHAFDHSLSTIDQHTLLKIMWHVDNVPRECTLFRATRATDIIHYLAQTNHLSTIKWLDMSAGWGDRLLAAVALDWEYVGFDPNPRLHQGYQDMVRIMRTPNQTRTQCVFPLPFECRASQKQLQDRTFTVIFTSPPYFDLEVYNVDDPFQSTARHPTPQLWLGSFLCYSVELASSRLELGGVFAMNLESTQDTPSEQVLCDFIASELPHLVQCPTFGFGSSYYPKPAGLVYSWQSRTATRGRTTMFREKYPQVYKAWQAIRTHHGLFPIHGNHR